MNKKEFDNCLKLHKMLKERIKGNIFVTQNGHKNISVNIKAGQNIIYTYNSDNIHSYDLAFENLVDEIVHDYKKFIINKFFYESDKKLYLGGDPFSYEE